MKKIIIISLLSASSLYSMDTPPTKNGKQPRREVNDFDVALIISSAAYANQLQALSKNNILQNLTLKTLDQMHILAKALITLKSPLKDFFGAIAAAASAPIQLTRALTDLYTKKKPAVHTLLKTTLNNVESGSNIAGLSPDTKADMKILQAELIALDKTITNLDKLILILADHKHIYTSIERITKYIDTLSEKINSQPTINAVGLLFLEEAPIAKAIKSINTFDPEKIKVLKKAGLIS